MPSHLYYLNLAKEVAKASKCERKKVGTVIVDKNGRLVSTGYNGTPKGTNNQCECDGITTDNVIHSEVNAILFAKQDLEDCIMYTTMAFCLRCAAMILQSGIKTVYYIERYRDIEGVQYLLDNDIKVYTLKEGTDKILEVI